MAGSQWLPRIGSVFLVFIFALGNYVLPLGETAVHWWVDIAWTLAAFFTAWRCFAVAGKLRSHEGNAWRLFGLGNLTWFLGMLYWDYQELVAVQATPFPAISDIGYLLFAPLFSAGLLFYRREAPSTPFKIMEFSQLGILIACIIVAHIVIFYEPTSRQELSVLYRVTALAYPALYMALLVQAVYGLWLDAGVSARRPLVLIVLGIAAHAVTNSFYAYSLLGHSYQTGNAMDIGWIIGFALIYCGAEERHRLQSRSASMPAASAALSRPLRLGGLIPPAALLATLLVVIIFSDRLQAGMIDLLGPAGVLLLLFLALREWASGAVQERLIASQRESEGKLRQLAHVVPVGILRIDLRGDCFYANEYCSEITGLPVSGHLGQGWLQALHPVDRALAQRHLKQAETSGGFDAAEYRVIRPDGAVVWVMARVISECDSGGEIIGYIKSITDITVRRESEDALRESEQRFRSVFASMPSMASVSTLSDGRFHSVNETFLSIMGFSREEVIGRTSSELAMWPDGRAAMTEKLRKSGNAVVSDWRLRVKSGEIRDVLGSFELMRWGNEECLLFIGQDVTERRQAEMRMKKLSSALEQTADAVMITDREGVIEYVNHAFAATTGYSIEEVVGKRPNILNSGKQGPEFYRECWDTILEGKVYSDVFINKSKDGGLYYEEKTITPLKDANGAITHFISTGHDITERIQAQERLQFLAHHDVLTGLPNRSLFLDRLNQALAYARWHNRLVAVLFLDVDRFKNINDTLGHDVGDKLLQAIVQRLTGCLRERDTVARFGGDEFVMVLSDIAASSDVGELAKRILDAMQPAFVVNDITLHATASIGISLFPGDGEEAGSLLSKADTAMYRAKDTGRNNFQFYSSEMSARAFERLAMENNLRLALERNEFVLHYQPQVDARDGRMIGLEALLRWQHPDLGLVPPLEFIPLLEETGLIIPVGEWVLRTACEQLAAWRREGHSHLRVAVNLSSKQFNNSDLLRIVNEILMDNRLRPDLLELEITESVLMRQDTSTTATFEGLSEMGVRFGLDDFGTGYSSLSYLRRFPIQTLKIDRSFVRDIPADAEDAAITHAIIVMGQSLNLTLIAEGVETKAQADFLQSLGCHFMQGYFFGRPMAAAEFTRVLTSPGAAGF